MKNKKWLIIGIVILVVLCIVTIIVYRQNKMQLFSELFLEEGELRHFLQYTAYLNEENDVNYIGMTKAGIKLDISSYYVPSYIYDESIGVLSYKKDDMNLAMKELFNENIDVSTESAYGLRYYSDIDSFSYESGGDGYVSTYLVKVEEQKYLGKGIYSVTFVYAYTDEANFYEGTLPECDCFKTEVKFKVNKDYMYSKYQLLNEDTMKSTEAGKIKDWQNL